LTKTIHLEFFVGVKEIAGFLGLHEKTCSIYLNDGKITAAKKDTMGRWVLTNLDYYNSLKEKDGGTKDKNIRGGEMGTPAADSNSNGGV
jgi:hypothetical protein